MWADYGSERVEPDNSPMNGLDLDLYLRMLQFDRSTLVLAAVVLTALGAGIWAGFGSRKLLRKCLILSVVSHVLIVRYGQPTQWVRASLGNGLGDSTNAARGEAAPLPPGIQSLEIVDVQLPGGVAQAARENGGRGGSRGSGSGILPSDLPETLPGFDSAPELAARLTAPLAQPEMPERVARENVALPAADVAESLPVESAKPERPRSEITEAAAPALANLPDLAAPTAIGEQERKIVPAVVNATGRPAANATVPLPVPDSVARTVRPGPMRETAATAPTETTKPAARTAVPLPPVAIAAPAIGTGMRRELPKRNDLPTSNDQPGNALAGGPAGLKPADGLAPPVPFISPEPSKSSASTIEGTPKSAGMLASNSTVKAESALPDTSLRDRIRNRDAGKSANPAAPERPSNRSAMELPKPDLSGAPPVSLTTGRSAPIGNRPLDEVPAPYRSRLDPDKAKLALQAGASTQSEKSVEAALEWLRKHQDADGRWDGGVAKYRDGTIAPDEDSFTMHCPPGEVCFGECFYWEADTALTGLSLLAYLGAGYTHTQGKYADTVARGLDFLILSQKADGDLRGRSVAVGMYCHSMATLALCEAYALTGDERLKQPTARAVAFLVAAQAEGGAAWRYEPKAPVGDTSILGWAVLALKSGRASGFPVPDDCIGGIQAWLDGVSSGKSGGLGKYQPWKEVTPTMTAEAWVCRWFLKLDPNANRNREAADHLFEHGPDRDPYNLYYWYYGTLGMFQQGGKDWDRWNALVRDRIVKRQKTSGHMAGSWDPDDSQWGNYGGRIYCTALATMTLEVYYRFLRTYDEATPATATTR